MVRKKKLERIDPLSDTALSHFWYCTKDRTNLQLNSNRWSRNSNFPISRNNITKGISNAIALRKINPESENQTRELVDYIFDNDITLEQVELVGVVCPVCGSVTSAPKINRVLDVGTNVGKSLYRAQTALDTKNYSRFRFIDHFGLGRYTQQQDGQGRGRSIFLWGWILGFGTIIMVFILYYILGFEMRLGRRWLPIGAILLVFTLLASIIFAFTIPEIRNLIGGFGRK